MTDQIIDLINQLRDKAIKQGQASMLLNADRIAAVKPQSRQGSAVEYRLNGEPIGKARLLEIIIEARDAE